MGRLESWWGEEVLEELRPGCVGSRGSLVAFWLLVKFWGAERGLGRGKEGK